MPRSIWSGAISFGLVNVPVKLYSAVSKKTVRFHQLHDKDGVRIQQKRYCPADDEEVAYEHIVKGYEISPDEYVVVTSEELDALEPQKTRAIDIEDYVDLDDIDPLFYDHPSYLLPDKYHDTYRERVLELIEKKAEGQEIVLQPVEEPKEVPDLMAALEESVKAAKGRGDGAKAGSGGRKRGAENGGGKKAAARRGSR